MSMIPRMICRSSALNLRSVPLISHGCALQKRGVMTAVSVKDLLQKKKHPEVLSVRESDKIRVAAKEMETKHIGSLLVKDGLDNCTGILTARDVQQALAENEEAEVAHVRVQDVMTPRDQLATASVNDSLYDVAEMMLEYNIRHLPVFKGLSNVGMLSIKDVVREVLFMEKADKQHLESIITDSYGGVSATKEETTKAKVADKKNKSKH